MGVKNLWDILSPVARPVQLDSLRQRKLAIDASIWLYQFLKAVRDKEGNALKNAHLVGFFRRICKLLFYNIRPVFVFDGGAPALKRLTIESILSGLKRMRERRRRRSEKTKDLKKTAEKILETQLKFQAINEHERRANATIASEDVKDVMTGNYTYLEELQAASAKSRKFRKDPYELPEDSGEIKKAKEKLDPRFASDEELRDFILEFKPSDLDVDSDMFRSLPTELQYEIIQDLKLKSRQTSWARLDEMIRKSITSLDFSKQQIQHLMHRNVMTQRLLDVNSSVGNEAKMQPVRIASERGRQYVLVKNEEVAEGLGWKLPGLNSDKGTEAKPLLEEDIQDEEEMEEEEKNVVPEDKVLQAIESNPSLQRLLKSMGDNVNTEHDNIELEPEEILDDSDLFVQSRPEHETSIQDSNVQADILDNVNAYVDDAMSIQDIMARFQSKQELDERLKLQHQISGSPPAAATAPTKPMVEDMSGPELVNYWIKNCPDAFLYEHSLNDEYKNIIKDVVYNLDVEEIETKLAATKRKLGKLASHDELRNESMSFYKILLEDTCRWKRLQVKLLEQFENSAAQPEPPAGPQTEKMDWMDSDDEFDALDYSLLEEPISPSLDLRLPKQGKTKAFDEEKDEKEKEALQISMSSPPSSLQEYGHMTINIPLQQSSLLKSTPEKVQEIHSYVASNSNTADGHTGQDEAGLETENIVEIQESDDEQWQAVADQFEEKNTVNLDRTELSSTPIASPEANSREVEVKSTAQTPPAHPELTQDFLSLESENESQDNELEVQRSVITENEDTQNTYMQEDQIPENIVDQEANDENIDEAADLDMADLHRADLEMTDVRMVQSKNLPVEQEGYDSDAELGPNLEAEDSEYARFVAEFGTRDYSAVRQEINEELIALGKDQRRQKRDMDELTTQMIEDAQELLRLFGIPYIISPMEAEAQCAELVRISLVDGVVTDDSDVFLFGASKVYKNVFNQEKYVECYMSNDVERELSLDRERLIQLAYLLGSDYTTGFAGVGQVAAMEILKEFQGDSDEPDESPLEPLKRFKEWFETPTLPKNETSDFRKKLRKKLRHMDMPSDFPNPHVREAYLSPHVDPSTQEFEWSMPDLDGLRRFLFSMLGWDEKKVDGLVVPVIKEMNSRKAAAQASIGHFFDISLEQPIQQPSRRRTYKSKRMQSVVQSLKKQDKGSKKRSTPDDTTNSRSTKRR